MKPRFVLPTAIALALSTTLIAPAPVARAASCSFDPATIDLTIDPSGVSEFGPNTGLFEPNNVSLTFNNDMGLIGPGSPPLNGWPSYTVTVGGIVYGPLNADFGFSAGTFTVTPSGLMDYLTSRISPLFLFGDITFAQQFTNPGGFLNALGVQSNYPISFSLRYAETENGAPLCTLNVNFRINESNPGGGGTGNDDCGNLCGYLEHLEQRIAPVSALPDTR